MRLTEAQKIAATNWWTTKITATGGIKVTHDQLASFSQALYSLLTHFNQDAPGLKGALHFIDAPSTMLAQALAHPGTQVPPGPNGQRDPGITWDCVPADARMYFTDDGHVLVYEGFPDADQHDLDLA